MSGCLRLLLLHTTFVLLPFPQLIPMNYDKKKKCKPPLSVVLHGILTWIGKNCGGTALLRSVSKR